LKDLKVDIFCQIESVRCVRASSCGKFKLTFSSLAVTRLNFNSIAFLSKVNKAARSIVRMLRDSRKIIQTQVAIVTENGYWNEYSNMNGKRKRRVGW
jgi:hypothetical protein